MSKHNTVEIESGPKRFDLVKPYEYRGQRYDMFVAREPKVRDLRRFLKVAESDSIHAIQVTLADLCGVDEPVIGEASIKDFGVMRKWFEDFLQDLIPDSEK
ncbi:phage tail assembly protein [Methylobacterium brachiatum]|uniref:phage tail assembly protein n=1 Tax=Methylobacterium brachiatum TaxID=269660 RepID=UPI000EFD7FEC|nr:phage tail assembly protein [Methylobacterium brachiatum]AYO84053.1 phage tail assembly protein [Methylobacterium brachiatum]